MALALITLQLIRHPVTWLAADGLFLFTLFAWSRIPLSHLKKEIQFWGVFLLLLFVLQVLGTEGKPIPHAAWLPVSRQGLRQGLENTVRLAVMLGYVLLFTSVTRPQELYLGLAWLLKPLSFLPPRRIPMMAALTLRFFSRLLDQLEEVKDAFHARSGGWNRNPVIRIKFQILPVLRRSFLQVEEVTCALMARGYDERVPLILPPIPRYQLLPLTLPLTTAVFSWVWG